MKETPTYPQCRIVPMRLLGPDTTRRLLNRIILVQGIRRILLNGQNLPLVVPYGPARGQKNENSLRRTVEIAGNAVELHVQVGTIILEVEDPIVFEKIREICEVFFVDFSYYIQEGTFIKTSPSVVDYARYGSRVDRAEIGLVDPKRKEEPVVLNVSTERICGEGEF